MQLIFAQFTAEQQHNYVSNKNNNSWFTTLIKYL